MSQVQEGNNSSTSSSLVAIKRNFLTLSVRKEKCEMLINILTLSFTQDTNHHYPTLAHLNASSSVIIHRRDLPMVSFNSELNSTHFSFKISGLHEKSTGRPLGERASSTLFPPKG